MLVSIPSVSFAGNTNLETSLCKDVILEHQEQVLMSSSETIEILYLKMFDQLKDNLSWQICHCQLHEIRNVTVA